MPARRRAAGSGATCRRTGPPTQMLNIMGTIDRPTRGDMLLCGERVTASTPDSVLARIRLQHCSYVFQAFNLIPTLTATENVALPLTIAGYAGDKAARAQGLLKAVGLAHRLDHKPPQLSGGEQQRVTIARALANRPELLLADEPTGDLDTTNSDIVMKLITDLNADKGMTVIMVTHDRGLAAFAHRVVHMVDGKVARVESVPRDTRQEALAALAASPAVRSMVASSLRGGGEADALAPLGGAGQEEAAHLVESGSDGSGPPAEASAPVPRPHTSVRKPGHYGAFRFSAKQREVMEHPAVGVLNMAESL